MKRVARHCEREGCRAWARKDGTLCASHDPRPRQPEGKSPAEARPAPDSSRPVSPTAGSAATPPLPAALPPAGQTTDQAESAANQRLLLEFFAGVFTKEEFAAVDRLVTTRGHPMEVEMNIIRVLLRRVMERIGEDDPLKALPLVRQAVDAMCRTLRTQRVLTGQAGESFGETLATLVEQWGQLAGLDDPGVKP